jgi:hypothetical protein
MSGDRDVDDPSTVVNEPDEDEQHAEGERNDNDRDHDLSLFETGRNLNALVRSAAPLERDDLTNCSASWTERPALQLWPVLAIIGLYGVLSLSVNSRIKEIAVRKAVGAQRHQIVQLVVGEGSRLVGVGLLLGATFAVLVGRALQALLFDVRPSDPIALGIAAIAFGAVAVTACLLPAFRASRVDLMQSLRQD